MRAMNKKVNEEENIRRQVQRERERNKISKERGETARNKKR